MYSVELFWKWHYVGQKKEVMLCGELCDSYLKHCWSKQVEHISRAVNTAGISIIAGSFIVVDQ